MNDQQELRCIFNDDKAFEKAVMELGTQIQHTFKSESERMLISIVHAQKLGGKTKYVEPVFIRKVSETRHEGKCVMHCSEDEVPFLFNFKLFQSAPSKTLDKRIGKGTSFREQRAIAQENVEFKLFLENGEPLPEMLHQEFQDYFIHSIYLAMAFLDRHNFEGKGKEGTFFIPRSIDPE